MDASIKDASEVILTAWKTLAYGCRDHPEYRGEGQSSCPHCERCVVLWEYRSDLETLDIILGRLRRSLSLRRKC